MPYSSRKGGKSSFCRIGFNLNDCCVEKTENLELSEPSEGHQGSHKVVMLSAGFS